MLIWEVFSRQRPSVWLSQDDIIKSGAADSSRPPLSEVGQVYIQNLISSCWLTVTFRQIARVTQVGTT